MWSLTNMGDTGNGFLASIAICQALFEREKTGKGQWCETAIVNAQLFNTSYAIAKPDGTPIEGWVGMYPEDTVLELAAQYVTG